MRQMRDADQSLRPLVSSDPKLPSSRNWKLEDRPRTGRPCLKEARAPCIAVEMEAIASEAASGTNSACEAWAYHHLSTIFFVESSSCTHTNCNRAMNFSQQIPHRGKQLRSGPSLTWNRIPPGFLTSCGQMKLISRFMVTLTTITVPFGRSLIHCPVKGWITETVNAQRYLTLLRETVVPCLIQRDVRGDRIVSRYPWPPRSLDLTPADFWLWGYLKSRVYLSGPSSLSELKDAIRREVSSIHPDVLHSAVAGFVTRLECLLSCGGGHVEHILV
ncbi:uncharacterized protein TNCV_2597341 [Trichonephila clavipes]|nr:uncharacterized protein TNCV_2597341 [Trichonephila clavipes]